MTKKQFIAQVWKPLCLPAIKEKYEQDGIPDYGARRQWWNDTVDVYIRQGELPAQAAGWAHPPSNDPRPRRK
jgi:methenyltetrahydromethanopterin cyclohydrolase